MFSSDKSLKYVSLSSVFIACAVVFIISGLHLAFGSRAYAQACPPLCGNPRPAGCTSGCLCEPGAPDYGNGDRAPGRWCAVPGGTCTCCVCPGGPPGPTDNYSPEGWLDSANCSVLNGWSGDADNGDRVVRVSLYADGSATPFATINANSPAEQAVCSTIPGSNCFNCPVNGVCPSSPPSLYPNCATHGGCLHRFSIVTPDSLKDGLPHTITAIGLNINSDGTETNPSRNTQLAGSPKTIRCPNPPTAIVSATAATANDLLVSMSTAAPGTGGRFYEAPVGTNIRLVAQAQSAITTNPKLFMVEIFKRNFAANNWTFLYRIYCGNSATPNGVCAGITYSFPATAITANSNVFVVNAYNQDATNGNQCSGNPYITYPNPTPPAAPNWFDCNVTTSNPTATSDVVTITGRPLYTLSGKIFEYNQASCSNIGTNVSDGAPAPNIQNNAEVTVNYTFNGVARIVTHGNIFNNPTNYTVSIPENSRITRITVGTGLNPLDPALGDYRLADLYGERNACPISATNYYDFTASPIVMNSNKTQNLGFRLYSTTQWFTLLNSDLFANTAISDRVARTPTAPFSGYMIELTQNPSYGYAFSSGDLNDGSSNSRIVNRSGANRFGGFAEYIGTGIGNPFNFWDLNLGSVNASTYPTISSASAWQSLQENTLYRLTDGNIIATTYNVSNGGVAFVYYTGSNPVTFSGGRFTSTGGRVVLVSLSGSVVLPDPGAGTGELAPTFSSTPIVDLAIVTPYNITAPGSGSGSSNDDGSIVLRGIYASNIFTLARTRGFINNELYPSMVLSYDPAYIYRMTRLLRNNTLSDIPGLTVFDISWPSGD